MGPGVGFPLGSDCKLAWEAETEEGPGMRRRSAQLHPVTWALCSGSSPVREGTGGPDTQPTGSLG